MATTGIAIDGQSLATEVERLCAERNYDAAEESVEAMLDFEDLDAESRQRIWAARANAAVEYGAYAEAAERFRSAFRCDKDNYWLKGDCWLYRCRDARLRSLESDAFSELTAKVRLACDESERGSIRRTVSSWVLAMVHMGLTADDRPAPSEVELARRYIETAYAGEPNPRVVRARLRLLWVTARAHAERKDGVDAALAGLRQLRQTEETDGLREAFDYYEGRLYLLGHDWRSAHERFQAIVERDPGHQAALVRDVYCQRVRHGERPKKRKALIGRIDELLGPEHPPAGRPAHVFAPDLVAELHAERAALRKERDHQDTVADYRRALELRPEMAIAQRRLVRTLSITDDGERALSEARRFLGREREAGPEQDRRRKVPLLVDFGLVLKENERYDEALAHFEEAIQLQPDYSYAHAALCAAKRAQAASSDDRDHELRNAAEEAAAALAQTDPPLVDDACLRIEYGYALLGLGELEQALAEFELARQQSSSTDEDRAQAGKVDALRIERKFAEALRLVGQVGDDPGPHVLVAAGWLYAELGDLGNALKCYDQAYKRDPTWLKVLFAKARALRLLGRPTEAMRLLKSIDANSGSRQQRGQVLNELGWTALALGDSAAALKHFGNADRICPTLEPVQRGMLTAIAEAERPWTEVDSHRRRLPETAAGRANVLATLAFARLHRGELAEAAELLDRSRERARVERPKERPVTLLLLMGDKLLAAGDVLAANAIVEQLEEIRDDESSDDPRVALLKARLLTSRALLQEAQQELTPARLRWPESDQIAFAEATLSYRRGDYADARDALGNLVEACPDHVPARELLVWTLIQLHALHDRDALDSPSLCRAARHCDELRKREPTCSSLAECSAAIAALRGNAAAARLYLTEASRRPSQSSDAVRNQAAVWYLMGGYEEAIACLDRMPSDDAHAAGAALLKGRACYELGRPETVAHLRDAMKGDPRDPVAPVLLATTLERERQPEEALGVLEEGLRRVPRSERARLLLSRARLLSERALELEDKEADTLLREAQGDLSEAQRLERTAMTAKADRRQIASEVNYHLGVIEHQRKRHVRARRAFQRAIKLGDGHPQATRALDLTPRASGSREDVEARRWRLGLAALTVLLMLGTVAMALLQAHFHPEDFQWSPAIWVIGVLLFVFILAVTLPRLAGFELGRQVKLNLHVQTTSEPSGASLRLPLPPPPSAALIAGPSAYVQYDLPSDPT